MSTDGSSPTRNSLLEIQQEQAREQQSRQQSQRSNHGRISQNSSRRSNNNNNHNRKGPGNRDNLPIEQGVICSMKESFGFIHCADRPEELFFHYSEVKGIHPDDLQIDDEVEFRVGAASTRGNRNNYSGQGDTQKMAAYQVSKLSKGTVVWEIEQSPGVRVKGVVERAVRTDDRRGGGRGNNNAGDEGTIRLWEEPKESGSSSTSDKSSDVHPEEGKEQTRTASGPLVRFLASAYSPGEGRGEATSTAAGDTSNRTPTYRRSTSNTSGAGRLFRGDLVECSIYVDRRTKFKFAKQITLIQSERERLREVKEIKLLESATMEEGIVTSLKSDYGFLRSNKRREDVYFHYSNMIVPEHNGEEEDFVLKEGQEMKFLVVTENDTSNSKKKCSARQVECLPKGSVLFHTVVAQGVMGIVTQNPQPPGNTGQTDERDGTVRLLEPIQVPAVTASDSTMIEDVSFRFGDSPGGVFSYQHRGSSVVGLWTSEGDTLLFDVVRETSDGCYRIFPTQHNVPVQGELHSERPADGEELPAKPPSVKLVKVSTVGRAEGVIHTIKETGGYGFIHLAERNVDVHFKVYDVLPDGLQTDLQRHMGGMPASSANVKNQASVVKLKVGASVQFDLSAHGTVPSGQSSMRGRGARGGGGQERENLKAQRVLLLPSTMPVKMERVLASGIRGVVKSEDAKQLYAGFIELDEEVVPMTLEDRYPLISRMIDEFLEESAKPTGRKVLVFRDLWSIKDDDVVVELVKTKGKGLLACTHVPVPGLAPHPGRICIRRVVDREEAAPTASIEDGNDGEDISSKKKQKKKGSKTGNASTKTVRFDKSNLVDDLKEDVPPGPGDVITCDVVQVRRTGKIVVQNVQIVERQERDAGIDENLSTNASAVGIVKEVVPNRNFGFINVLDENASKREMLFFQLGTGGKPKGVHKGDEVKFDVGVEKNGKRVALNVQVLPKGTIPSNPSKNACCGLILLEPSNTSLSDTPVRKVQGLHSASDKVGIAGGRWAQQKVEPQKKAQQHLEAVEEGYILLTEDKTGMFSRRKGRSKSPKRSISPKRGSSPVPPAGTDSDDARSLDGDDILVGDAGAALFSHLSYKTGAIAIHGAGAASCVDGSSHPRRGDLVSFVRARSGKGVRDLRVLKRQAATLVRGRLEEFAPENASAGSTGSLGTAKFIAATEKEEEYVVDLSEVVSCDSALLKEKQAVEGILYEGKIYGICRTVDLYLESKLGASHKERPKLNLTVKKNRAGTIMAQSMMAKGPDGTSGFASGWTQRTSRFVSVQGTNVAAEEFTPGSLQEGHS